MYIECKNIDDFCTMITTCSLNNITDIRIFISENESFPSIAFENSQKNYVKFSYVLFTPLYSAIYTDNVKRENYEKIRETLQNCQKQCQDSFKIQVFEKISFNNSSKSLSIEKELKVL